jgi:hypothetical protein
MSYEVVTTIDLNAALVATGPRDVAPRPAEFSKSGGYCLFPITGPSPEMKKPLGAWPM